MLGSLGRDVGSETQTGLDRLCCNSLLFISCSGVESVVRFLTDGGDVDDSGEVQRSSFPFVVHGAEI